MHTKENGKIVLVSITTALSSLSDNLAALVVSKYEELRRVFTERIAEIERRLETVLHLVSRRSKAPQPHDTPGT